MAKTGFFDWFQRNVLFLGLLTAWVAMMGSLYFSEVLLYAPCTLCWYQRILMYPLAGIIAIGLIRLDANLPYYILPFSLIGQGFSTYHYLVQKTQIFGAPTACRSGVPCTTVWINWLGFITIPFLAMMAFFIITLVALIALMAGEPALSRRRAAPWGWVLAIIISVLVLFVLFASRHAAQSQSAQNNTALAAVSTSVPAVSPSSADETSPSETSTNIEVSPLVLDEGRKLYALACTACHGPDGRGVANLGPSLVDAPIINSEDTAQILAVIRAGIHAEDPQNTTGMAMPPSGGRPDLTDGQLIAIVAYLREQ